LTSVITVFASIAITTAAAATAAVASVIY